MDQTAAESITKHAFSDPQKRMHELAEKKNRGLINEAERGELGGYLRVGSFLNLMKAMARNSISKM